MHYISYGLHKRDVSVNRPCDTVMPRVTMSHAYRALCTTTLSGMDDVQGRRLSTMLCQCESFIIMSNRAYRQNRSNPHKYQCCYLLKQTTMSIGTARGIDSTYCIHGLPRPSIWKKPSSYRINRRWLCRARARQCHSKVKNEERR